MKRYELINEHWNRIVPLLPPKTTGKRGRPKKANCAMLWTAQSAVQRRELPELYSSWQSVHTLFSKWRDNGTLRRIFLALSQDTDMKNLSIDSTCVKVHESGNSGEKAGNKIVGRTKGGLNIKVHIIVDGLGNPVEYLLSASHDNNSMQLLKKVNLEGSTVLEERAYGTEKI